MSLFPEPPNRIVRRARPTPFEYDRHGSPRAKLPLRSARFVPSELDHPDMPLYSSVASARASVIPTKSDRGKISTRPRFSVPPRAEEEQASALRALQSATADRSPLRPRQSATAGDGVPLTAPRPASVPQQCATRVSEKHADWTESTGFEVVAPLTLPDSLDSERSTEKRTPRPQPHTARVARLPNLFDGSRPTYRPLNVKFM